MHAFLTNPAYAGAFVFGRTSQKKRLDPTGRVRRRTIDLPIEQWSVCLPEHHPGYVSWEEYLATRERLRTNVRPRGEGGGAAREGVALLQGIIRCGRCGRRMQVAYSGNKGNVPRYACVRAHQTARHRHGLPIARRAPTREGRRRRVPGGGHPGRDARLRRSDRRARARPHERLHGQRLAVERAEFEAGRAQRQFDACEPEHRLVARTLEARLEEALAALERERRKLAELEARRPEPLTDLERQALTRLVARPAADYGRRDSTTPRDRKELLRTLISEVDRHRQREPAPSATSDHLGGRRADRADRAAGQARHRAQPHQRGHDRAGPQTRGAHQRSADRRDPQQARPPHRDRTGVQRSPACDRAPSIEIPPRPPLARAASLFTVAQAAIELGVAQSHDLSLAACRAAPRRADHPARAVADPAHRRGARAASCPTSRTDYLPLDEAAKRSDRPPDRFAQGPTR